LLDKLNSKVVSGEIAWYMFDPGTITIYSEHGHSHGILLSPYEIH
jgi:hypothetical protein